MVGVILVMVVVSVLDGVFICGLCVVMLMWIG